MTELLTFENLEETLNEFMVEVRDLYQHNYIDRGKWASGDLFRSADDCEVTATANGYKVIFHLQDYWEDVERGSMGAVSSPQGATGKVKLVPRKDLLHWIEIKPVIPTPGIDGSVPSPETLAFLIQRKIYNKGVAPEPLLADSVAEAMEKYRPLFVEALLKDTKGYVRKLVVSAFEGFGGNQG